MTLRSLWSTLFKVTWLLMRSFLSLGALDSRQPALSDVRDQLPVGRERSQHLASQRRRFAKKCVGAIAVVEAAGRDGRLRAKAHPVQHVLVARRWKHFFDPLQVVARGRLVSPQHEQVAQPL